MLQWALLGLAIVFLLVAYVVIQGTRAALAWRKAAEAGDVKVIRDILDDAISGWGSMKRPKNVAVEVWRGVQSAQTVDVGRDFVRVSCQAEGEYRLVNGRWLETSNPLQEGFAMTAQLAEMLLYELGHFRPQRVQIDVYTTFREADAPPRLACVLSTDAVREEARRVDWDEWTAEAIVDVLGGRYRLGEGGRPLPIEVEPPAPAEPAPDGSASAAQR